ncbi:hypothetical protein FQR65_LT09890 [Abscondita terminalis]|nr:hypothetical protein FQR65_LT09890 [Abscondita terminalis]
MVSVWKASEALPISKPEESAEHSSGRSSHQAAPISPITYMTRFASSYVSPYSFSSFPVGALPYSNGQAPIAWWYSRVVAFHLPGCLLGVGESGISVQRIEELHVNDFHYAGERFVDGCSNGEQMIGRCCGGHIEIGLLYMLLRRSECISSGLPRKHHG